MELRCRQRKLFAIVGTLAFISQDIGQGFGTSTLTELPAEREIGSHSLDENVVMEVVAAAE